jgi:hypothetical protein
VLDFYRDCVFADFPCNPSKPLIYKACSAAGASYQQSYPQECWTVVKAVLNQALSSTCEGETGKIPAEL